MSEKKYPRSLWKGLVAGLVAGGGGNSGKVGRRETVSAADARGT